MPNALTAFNPAFWETEMQSVFNKENVAIALANTQLHEILNQGDTWHRPSVAYPRARTYTKGTDITVDDLTATDEIGIVNTAKVVPFYVDDLDRIQNKWDAAAKFAAIAQRLLNNVLDQLVAAEVSNAGNIVDAGDVGGAAGSGASLSVSTISQLFTAASRKLDSENVAQGQRFALIGPRILEILRLYLAGRDTGQGDIVGMNGKVMERFGFQIFYSNNLRYTATLTIATTPIDGDTVSVGGVTFTFKTTLGATAGNVLIGGSADAARLNLINAINDNGSGTEGTDFKRITADNREKLEKAGIVATDNPASDTMTIVAYGDIVVAETLTAGGDVWSAQLQHALFGELGFTDLVVQKKPNVEFRLAEKRLGRFVYPWMLYGIKTFTQEKKRIVNVKIDASAWK